MIHRFNPLKNPPQYLFIEITKECNLRCKQCHNWMVKEVPEKLISTSQKSELIDEFFQLNPHGTVVFTGGEPMKKREEFYRLSKKCRDYGLSSAANTNGTYIFSENEAHRLLTEGPKYIVISLDSHKPELHDNLRGIDGTYEKVLRGIEYLVSKMNQANDPSQNSQIIVNSILCEINYLELEDLIEFVRSLGVDGITFQIISRTFSCQTSTDPAFEFFFPQNIELCKGNIDKIVQKYGKDPFVATSTTDFEWMKLYLDDPDFIGQPVCNSHTKNMMIDCYGEVQLCFGMTGIFGNQTLGNISNNSLHEIWTSDTAAEARAVMSKCRKNCGMLNCHRSAK